MVICEYESFVTETVITARCVGTVLITSSVVLKTLVYICITHAMHTLYTIYSVRMCMQWCFHSHNIHSCVYNRELSFVFEMTHHVSSDELLNTAHTVGLTAATILADATVTPPSPK